MVKPLNPVFADLPTTIFTVMSELAGRHQAVNLGQGFPDTDGPEAIRKLAAQAILDGPNQYAPGRGISELRRAVANHNQRFYQLETDWQQEVIVTSGATEALAASIAALVRPGDEVIVLEPAYDSYVPMIRAFGGIPVFVRLEPPDWHFNKETLASAFSSKTKAVIINSPMNPNGKVFSHDELSLIAALLCEHDTYAICDEVYEHLVFDNHRHIPLITLPKMRDRCIRIGSAGKTFSLTGWKTGYITAATPLADTVARVHQFLTFATPPALQKAIAAGLASEDDYFSGLAHEMQSARDMLSQGLADCGFSVLPCHGTYFITCDFTGLAPDMRDEAFCRYITTEAGVAAIPISAFYSPGQADIPYNLVRFCFCKPSSVLDEAVRRLQEFFQR